MPKFGATRLLSRPRFRTTFTVKRRVQTNTDGYGSIVTTTYPGVAGVVSPLGSRELLVLSEGQRNEGQITVITAFRLTDGAGATTIADLIEWKGNDYTVASINDWSEYGAGYIEARCELLPVRPT